MRSLLETIVGWGPLGIFVIAVVDSAGVPLPGGVDALLITVSVLKPDSAWIAAGAAIIGSVLGSWFLFSVAQKGGQAYLDRHTLTPRGKKLRGWFQHYGLVTVFVPALLPIPLPLKVAILCAGALGVRRKTFLATILAARIPRYLGLAWLGVQTGNDAGQWLKDHAWHIFATAALVGVVLFGFIWWKDRNRPQQA